MVNSVINLPKGISMATHFKVYDNSADIVKDVKNEKQEQKMKLNSCIPNLSTPRELYAHQELRHYHGVRPQTTEA